MSSNRLTLRFAADELSIIKTEAAASGLTVSTFVKATLRTSLKFSQFDARIVELFDRDREIWKKEATAVLFVRELLRALAERQGYDERKQTGLETQCRQRIDELFAEVDAKAAL